MNRLFVWMERRGLRERIVDGINRHVDIPMIDEETEAKVFDAMYGIMKNAFMDAAVPVAAPVPQSKEQQPSSPQSKPSSHSSGETQLLLDQKK
jgi:hypothetical protein